MKKAISIIPFILYIVTAVILCGVFLAVLLVYSRPMEDLSLDLSLMNKDSHVALETNDEKGWTVYTQSGDTVKPLEPTGVGSYRGIDIGETFYYSRVMSESLDSPTLQIGTAERMFSIWLDDELIYTDCPELDNRIGYVTLPMNTELRQKPLVINLPSDYKGKTLTIAQSTPPYSETSTVTAIPASVMLYCGYAYESGIIAESVSISIAATFVFVIGLLLMIAFVRNRDMSMLCMALSAFLWMCVLLLGASFFSKYFGTTAPDVNRYVRLISAVVLTAFLTLKAGRLKPVMWSVVGLQSATVLLSLPFCFRSYPNLNYEAASFQFRLMEWEVLAGLLAIIVLSMVFWRKENQFYRVFAPLILVVIAVGWPVLVFASEEIRTTIPIALASGQATLIYQWTFIMFLPTAVACAVYEVVRQEVARRSEKAATESRHKLMQTSYENMQRQHEDVMKIKHDIAGHLESLKGLVENPRALAYIDELIGQQQHIRSVVQTGNKMLDLILNNKLSEAQDAGVQVDIVKAEAPGKLPLTDADLCSLVMNLMSNAVKASIASGAASPYIRLDIHVKNDYFAFTCENSADMTYISPKEEKETVHEHGLGVKIISNIVEQYNGLIEIKQSATSYEARIAIPLFSL